MRRVRLDGKACRFVEVDRVCFDYRKACRILLKVERVRLQQRKAYRRLVQVRRVVLCTAKNAGYLPFCEPQSEYGACRNAVSPF